MSIALHMNENGYRVLRRALVALALIPAVAAPQGRGGGADRRRRRCSFK